MTLRCKNLPIFLLIFLINSSLFAEDTIGDFTLASSRIKQIVEPRSTSFAVRSGVRYITDHVEIDTFARYYGSQQSSWILYMFADSVHLGDCLFLDFDLPSLGDGDSMETPSSCEALDKLSKNRRFHRQFPTGGVSINQGSVNLVIRNLTCEPGKYLYVDASRPVRDGRGGGRFRYLINESAEPSSCLKIVGDEGISERTNVISFSSRQELGRAMNQGASFATVYALYRVMIGIEKATATKDGRELAKLAKKIGELATVDVVSEHQGRFGQLLRSANETIDSIGNWHGAERLTVSRLGSPTTAEVVYDLKSITAHTIPNRLLVVPSGDQQGKRFVGALEFDPSNAEEIGLVVDTVFGIDPYIDQEIQKQLEGNGWSYGGATTSWSLSEFAIDIVDYKGRPPVIVPKADGTGATLKFYLRDPVPNSLMLILSSEKGIPLRFKARWPSGSVEERTVAFSLARMSELPFGQSNSDITNLYPVAQNIEYLGDGAGLTPLQNKIVVAANGQHALSDGTYVPVMGVFSDAFTSNKIPSLFRLTTQNATVSSIRVQNLLGTNEQLDESLDHVEIKVSLLVDGEVEYSKGPYRLAPVTADGSEVTISFISEATDRVFLVESTAMYSGGSRLDLKPIRQESNVVKITANLLPPIQ